MIYQTDDEFEPDIQHFGCYFLSLMYQLNRFFAIPVLDHKVIEAIYVTCEHTDANNNGVTDMQPECFISDPQGVVDFVVPGRVIFAGAADKAYTCQSGEFAIQEWFNPKRPDPANPGKTIGTDFHHFVAEGHDGGVEYDPIEGGSVTVRNGSMISKRIYRIKSA